MIGNRSISMEEFRVGGGGGWRETEFRPSSSNNEVEREGGVVFLPRRFVRQERWFVIIELIETVNCWSRKLTVARWYGKYRSFWTMCLIEIIKFLWITPCRSPILSSTFRHFFSFLLNKLFKYTWRSINHAQLLSWNFVEVFFHRKKKISRIVNSFQRSDLAFVQC